MSNNTRTTITIEVPAHLAHKIESTLLDLKMKALKKKSSKPQKRAFIAYLLETGLANFTQTDYAAYEKKQESLNV